MKAETSAAKVVEEKTRAANCRRMEENQDVRKWRVLSGKKLAKFQLQLLEWYRRHRRALPFRGTRDSYRIWIAEVMLQQTRVSAAVPYYERFLRRFPTVKALARAPESEVLKLWAGLGYYSRARHLHRAAKQIVARHGGRFPRDREAALALPGVGEYTAAAVLSIAYDEPLAVLDGNVARVIGRQLALRGDLRGPGRWRQLARMAQELMPPRGAGRAGQWNQAMMELGATVCLPRAPRCAQCPVQGTCAAFERGIQEQIPEKRKKRPKTKVALAAAVLLDRQDRTLLVKPNAGNGGEIFSRLWQFPAVELTNAHEREWKRRIVRLLESRYGPALEIEQVVPLGKLKHAVTFREITLLPVLVRVKELSRVTAERLLPWRELGEIPVSSATRKIAAAADEYRKLHSG
jgi:A/G-specific adenine glycosylase